MDTETKHKSHSDLNPFFRSSADSNLLTNEISGRIQNEVFQTWSTRIDHKIDFAESMSAPRTQWPQELNKFPIKYFKLLQKLFLKVLSALFRDQRQINYSLVQALRETLVLNRVLLDQVNDLSLRVSPIEQINQSASMTYRFHWSLENRLQKPRTTPERLNYYLLLIRATLQTFQDSMILDLSHQKGDWLELLDREGIRNSEMRMNPNSKESDAITYLKNLPSESLTGITGFHIFENMPIGRHFELLSESIRVLKPGGIAIFETPLPAPLDTLIGYKR